MVGAGLGLVVFAPIILIVAVAVLAGLGHPILFRQPRPGRLSKPFVLLKFRTMALDGSETVADSARLSRFGHFLRATSLDELPQLLNVLRGDMSLVGPRPLLPEYLALYSETENRRHEVRPGITGWAQVQGRNELTWRRRFECDVWYVDHHSLSLDSRIIWLTLGRVIQHRGVSQPGHATAERFRGHG